MIRHLELHNFASHNDTELEFVNGKNVIIGATGTGKTNILQAIDFAFLGDVPDASLPELIADDSDWAEVSVDYDDPRTGQTYRIQRTLKRGPEGRAEHECSLTNLATGEAVKRPEPVRKTLESFGVDPSIWRYIIHVAQGKFGDLLEETQERKTSLDRLFGVSQLEGAHQELGRREGPITQIELRKQANVEKKARLERDAGRLEAERANLRRMIEQRKKKGEDLEKLKKELGRLEELSEKSTKTLVKLKIVDDAIRMRRIASENALKQINSLVTHLRELLPPSICTPLERLPSKEITDRIQELQDDLRKTTQEEERLKTAHRKSIEKASDTQSRLEREEEDREAIRQQLESIEKYLVGKGRQPKVACDRCGSILTKAQWKKHLEEQRGVMKQLENTLLETRNKVKSEQSHVAECDKRREDATSRIKIVSHAIAIAKQIEEQRRITEAEHDPELSKTRAELLIELRTLLSADPQKSEEHVIEEASSLASQLKSLPSRIRELSDELNSFDEDSLNPQKNRVDDAEKAKLEVDRLAPEISRDEKRISLLEMIRTSFREIQPVLRRNFVWKITESANDYLKRLYRGAELKDFELTQDYQFLVTRADYKRRARRLSGGQQVLTSMAFLLALSEVLSQLDFLILDEPTTHLDESRRKELVTVLENLRRVPQIIIVDHHPELFEAADSRFQVRLTPEGESQVALIEKR